MRFVICFSQLIGNRNKASALLTIILLLSAHNSYCQAVTGYITSENSEPLISANVVVVGANTGVSTNKEGNYFIKLKPGKYKLYVSYLGFRADTFDVSIKRGETIKKDVKLKTATFSTNPVFIFSSYHTTAELIVLNAITRKEEYLSKIKNYEYSAYSRTSFILKTDSLKENIGGITEVQSQGYFESPNNFQEVILAKKQTANFSSLYNIFSSGRPVSVLDDNMKIDELSVISPLSKNALNYYSYDVVDTMYTDSKRIFNLKFSPKAKNLPLFEGTMSIVDVVFTVTDVELNGKEKVKAATKSDILLKQSFREFENYFWFPIQFSYNFSLDLGIQGLRKLFIAQQGSFFNYKINNKNFNHDFNDRVVLQTEMTKKEEDSLWESAQYIPLSADEQEAYSRLDSLMKNKNFVMKTLIKLPDLYLKLKNLPVTDFSDFYHYNRVEGNYAGAGLELKNKFGFSELQISSGYGFGDKKAKYFLAGSCPLNKYFSISASLYDKLSFLDSYYDYRKSYITLNQLLVNNDFADYYYSRGYGVGLKVSFNEKVSAGAAYGSEINNNAQNTSSYSLFNKSREPRLSIPVVEGRFNKFELSFTYDDRKYLDYGWGNIQNKAEDFLYVNLNYKFAPAGFNDKANSFNSYYFQMSSLTKFPPYFNILVALKAGFIDKDSVIQQNFHLPGIYSVVTNTRLFHTLKNDEYIGDKYLGLFFENNFKNTIFNLLSLPYLKNSKFDLYANANIGWMNNKIWGNGNNERLDKTPFSEAGFGIGNIFFFMRVDFMWRITHREKKNFYVNFSSNISY